VLANPSSNRPNGRSGTPTSILRFLKPKQPRSFRKRPKTDTALRRLQHSRRFDYHTSPSPNGRGRVVRCVASRKPTPPYHPPATVGLEGDPADRRYGARHCRHRDWPVEPAGGLGDDARERRRAATEMGLRRRDRLIAGKPSSHLAGRCQLYKVSRRTGHRFAIRRTRSTLPASSLPGPVHCLLPTAHCEDRRRCTSTAPTSRQRAEEEHVQAHDEDEEFQKRGKPNVTTAAVIGKSPRQFESTFAVVGNQGGKIRGSTTHYSASHGSLDAHSASLQQVSFGGFEPLRMGIYSLV
jgi:hypothetical protein